MTITHPLILDFDCTGRVIFKHGKYYCLNFKAFLFGHDVTDHLDERDLKQLEDSYLTDYIIDCDYEIPEIETREIG